MPKPGVLQIHDSESAPTWREIRNHIHYAIHATAQRMAARTFFPPNAEALAEVAVLARCLESLVAAAQCGDTYQ